MTEGWFNKCEEVFKNDKSAAFASPKQLNSILYNIDKNNFLNFFNKIKKNKYYKSFDECAFACVITKREVLNKIGNFDEIYTPAFFEDDDLKYRAVMNGYGVYVCNNTCFYHSVSATSYKHKNNFYKNREHYYSKYPFAEYLAVCRDEKNNAIISLRLTSISLISILNKINNFKNKAWNRIRKGIIKH